MSGVPVVIAENGFGVPVNPVDSGAPLLTVAANGRGTPIVISENGAPFIVQGLWSPAKLFDGGLAGHWAGGYMPDPSRPMAQRIFQDPAGTIPAILPGQPVGLVKRMAGDVNATQAVALAKPTLVRWPATGRRNLANGAQAYGDTTYWPESHNQAGVRTNVIERSEGHIRMVTYGASTLGGGRSVYLQSLNFETIPIGTTIRSRFEVRVLSGLELISDPADGFRCETGRGDGTPAPGPVTKPSETGVWHPVTFQTVTTGASAGTTSPKIRLSADKTYGTSADDGIVWEVRDFQTEIGDVDTPLQHNYGPNNITEPGVPDRWHLYNDGGDSLESVLPAGTYGTAHLIADGSYALGTMVSDGVTPITTIPNDRQVDCIYRLGAFTTEEQADILAYWQRKYPL